MTTGVSAVIGSAAGAKHIDAVHIRQMQIQEDQIGPKGVRLLQPCTAILGVDHVSSRGRRPTTACISLALVRLSSMYSRVAVEIACDPGSRINGSSV